MSRGVRLLLAGFLLAGLVAACATETEPPPAPPIAADATPREILDTVRERVHEAVSADRVPVVVLDLDGTLFHNGPRTKQIWLDHARTTGNAALLRKLEVLDPFTLPYRVDTALTRLGVTDPAERKGLMDAWVRGFFSNEYPHWDVPLDGGPAFVDDLYRAGAFVVYLTGRDAPRMLLGSARSLQDSGYPVGVHRTELAFKPDKAVEDSLFKTTVFDHLDRLGEVVACFENEPGNINALHARFPRAVSVFVDTNHRPEAPPVAPTIPSLRSFAP